MTLETIALEKDHSGRCLLRLAVLFIVATVGISMFGSHINLGQAADCYIVSTPTGNKRVCDKPPADAPEWAVATWDWSNTEWDCRAGKCDRCGVCHVDPPKEARKNYPAESHLSKYQYDLKPGERIPWANGTYVTIVGGRKCLVRDGRHIHCFP